TLSQTRGFMKALIGTDDRILGFTAFGAEASEPMAVVQTAMLGGMPYTALRDAIFTHPTTAEGLIGLFTNPRWAPLPLPRSSRPGTSSRGEGAEGISSFVSNSPLMSWAYKFMSIRGFSAVLGVVEVAIAILIAVRPLSARASILGSALAVGMFLTTLSFLITTPG